jgi:hypothetical protein
MEFTDSTKNRCGLTNNTCPTGYTKFTDVKNGVGVCGCKKNATETVTPTPTKTKTPTPTKTKTPTVTGTVITTVPPTALISDKADRIILGVALFSVGVLFFNFNFHIKLGNLFWDIRSGSAGRAKKKKEISKERHEFEDKFND